MNGRLMLHVAISLALATTPLLAQTQEAADSTDKSPFFAFDNGTGRNILSTQVQAKMLSQLGYDGIGYTGSAGIPEMLQALDAHDLQMFSIYVGARVGSERATYDPQLKQAIRQLQGRPTMIWLTIQSGPSASPELDEQAVGVLREIADAARESGLRVALYPHTGFYVARIEDALRLVEKADRENVGVSFNLCHFLKQHKEEEIESALAAALPHLLLVSINGADRGATQTMGWDRLIQTLDRGDLDVKRVLDLLKRLGYQGPIGLQCYNVPGDRRDNLKRSMDAWQSMTAAAKAGGSDKPSAAFRLEETSDVSLCILDGDQPVLTYNHGVITASTSPRTMFDAHEPATSIRCVGPIPVTPRIQAQTVAVEPIAITTAK